LDRLRAVRQAVRGREIEIAVDGGIHAGNVAEVVAAGGEVIVAGSAIFSAADRLAAMRALLEAAE
jgi:ribulose-phosphate 3-epimerase